MFEAMIATSRRALFVFLSIGLGFLLSTRSWAANQSLPNVVIFYADDQGYQDLGCYGSPDIETPHIDRLAREGMQLYDLKADISESKNLADTHEKLVRELNHLAETYDKKLKANSRPLWRQGRASNSPDPELDRDARR